MLQEIDVMTNILYSRIAINSNTLLSRWNFMSVFSSVIGAVVIKRFVFSKPFKVFPRLISAATYIGVALQMPFSYMYAWIQLSLITVDM